MGEKEKALKDKPGPNSKVSGHATKFKKLLSGKKRAAIFTHAGPDPDAIGSMMAMEWLLSKFDIEVDCFFDGKISHPQNIAMTNLLDLILQSVGTYQPGYDICILLDAVPANAGTGNPPPKFDCVIDHHREPPNGGFDGLYINLKAGSTAATLYHLMSELDLQLEDDNDYDSRVATALLVGIYTDTENMTGDESTEYEFNAWPGLFEFRNATALKRIVNFEIPKYWIDLQAEAVGRAHIQEGVGIVGLGIIPAKHRDVIADMASKMVTWEDINTAVVFALIEGSRIEGSVRSVNASMPVPEFCKALGEKYKGKGGGRLGKGAYTFALGGGSVDEEDDADTAKKVWDLYNEKETKRILRQIRK